MAENMPPSIRRHDSVPSLRSAVESNDGAFCCQLIGDELSNQSLPFVAIVGSNHSNSSSHNGVLLIADSYALMKGTYGSASPFSAFMSTEAVFPDQL
jgi:hypothetical protein